MVEDRITDGVRIAELLASELDGRGGELSALSVVEAVRDVEPTADGARAYDVRHDATGGDPGEGGDPDEGDEPGGDDRSGTDDGRDGAGEDSDREDVESRERGERVARVYVQPDRVRVELVGGVDAEPVVGRARSAGLRVRPVAADPPRAVLFVESGAETKRAADALGAVRP